MPPKGQKKGVDSEDFSDLPTLPQANIFKFTVAYSSFLSLENREKVTKRVTDNLVSSSGDKVKMLTREDIITYGKSKQIILDAPSQQALPADDTRRDLTEEQQIARACADRLFELQVLARRARKEQITKLEEEAQAKAEGEEGKQAEPIKFDHDQIDQLIYLVDYPSTTSEALTLATYSNALNGVFEVSETKETTADDKESEQNDEENSENDENDEDSNEQEKQEGASNKDGENGTKANANATPDSDEEQTIQKKIVTELYKARKVSAKNSPLRQMAFIKMNFVDEEVELKSTDAEGNPVTKMRPAEDQFISTLLSQGIDKYGQLFVQYGKFRNLVVADPLVPDKVALEQIRALEAQGEELMGALEETDQNMEEEVSNLQAEKQDQEGSQNQEVDSQIEAAKQRAAELRQKLREDDRQRKAAIKKLSVRTRISLDDERDPSSFNMKAYQANFVKNEESDNKVQTLISAMIGQIAVENKDLHEKKNLTEMGQESALGAAGDTSTQAETTLDDMFSEFEHEIACDLKIKDRGADPAQGQSLADSLEARFNKNNINIHEEMDKTLEVQQTIPLGLLDGQEEKVRDIMEHERQMLSNLNLPGKDRNLMPTIPTKSQRAREFENPGFYPFCTLPVNDAERMLLLKQFQQLVKQNFIDQGASASSRHNKSKVFERTYETHLGPEIYQQVFAEALLDDPDIASLYYPRQDQLLVALFNKSAASGEQAAKFDGEKNWAAAYRVMPDFQNWIAFFSDEIIMEQEVHQTTADEATVGSVAPNDPKAKKGPADDAIDPTAITMNHMKFTMDEEMIPDHLLDVDDSLVQSVRETSQLMYPDDNSVMRVDNFSVGGQNFSKSLVMKDNLKFGLRQRDQTKDDVQPEMVVKQAGETLEEEDSPDEGLVSYKPVGDSEFWCHFENGTKFGVEQVKLARNPYRVVKVEPAPLTEEEKVQREEQVKAAQAAAAKAAAKGAKGGAPAQPDIEMPKDPEPTFIEKELNALDRLFSDEMLEQAQALSTLTLANGLIMQYTADGKVVQTSYQAQKDDKNGEFARFVTKEGIVVRQLRNRDAEVMFPDGVRATFCKQSSEWVITNNKGRRRMFCDRQTKDLEPIPCATETDALTEACMLIREDNVCTVTYKDGSVFCQHPDGTQIFTNASGSEIRIEKENCATHVIKIDSAANEGDEPTSPRDGLKNPYERALDQRVIETYLPDGTTSLTFADQVVTKKGDYRQVCRTLFRRADLSVVISDGEGRVSIISSNSRAALNEAGNKSKLDYKSKDTDYLRELSRDGGQFIPTVYQARVSEKPAKSTIKTKNFKDNTVFVLKCDMTLEKRQAEVTQQWTSEIDQQKSMKSRQLKNKKSIDNGQQGAADMEIEETGNWEEPMTKFFTNPRFFVVNSDGSAKELLSGTQLDYSLRKKKIQVDKTIKQKMADVFNNHSLANHYFLTKVINMKQKELEHQQLKELDFPANAVEVLHQHIQAQEISLLIPRQEQYLYQQIFQLPDCDTYSQQAFCNDYQRYLDWRMSHIRYETEFAIVHHPPGKDQPIDWEKIEDEEYGNRKICDKILKFRSKPAAAFNADNFKSTAMEQMAKSGEVSQFRSSLNKSLQASRQGTSVRDSQDVTKKSDKKNRQQNQGANKKQGGTLSQDSSMEVLSETEESPDQQAKNELLKNKFDPEKVKERHGKIRNILQQQRQVRETGDFVNEYFKCFSGDDFLQKHPPIPVSDEVIIRMKQRIERAQGSHTRIGENVSGGFEDGNSMKGSNANAGGSLGETVSQERSNDMVMVGDNNEDRDNPIVALEPDEALKQGSAFLGSKQNKTSMDGAGMSQEDPEGTTSAAANQSLPSLYMQEKIYLYNREQEHLLRAEEHHIVKTKDFNVYGRLREEQPNVKVLTRSKAPAELNEKFITTECITDRRVKISSMANRFYVNAPSVNDVRKQGQHQMILGAISKKQTFAELINQANSMVTGVLHDSLKRSMNVLPSQVTFGALRPGTHNEITLTVKNEDSIAHRITIKPMQDKRILVKQEEYGIIAPGMIKKVLVSIRVPEDATESMGVTEGKPVNIKDMVQIMSKHDIFKIPVTAQIITAEEFEEQNRTKMEVEGKPIQNSRVRERLNRAIAQSRQSNRDSNEPELLPKKPNNGQTSEEEP